MAVSPHPSVKPSPPTRPPRTSTTQGTDNMITGKKDTGEDAHYGAAHEARTGNEYGAQHEVHVSSTPHKSEMAHHFSDFPKAGDHDGK